VLFISRQKKGAPRQQDTTLVNEKIRVPRVLVIGPNGEQVGERSSKDALTLAQAAGYDLVMVAPGAKPPVCKVMDYGKYRFEQQRKAKEARKNSKAIKRQEVRMTPLTDTNDINTKVKKTLGWLEKGAHVKVAVFFRGRQMQHQDLGRNVLKKFYEGVKDVADIEKHAKMEGRYMTMYIVPKK